MTKWDKTANLQQFESSICTNLHSFVIPTIYNIAIHEKARNVKPKITNIKSI